MQSETKNSRTQAVKRFSLYADAPKTLAELFRQAIEKYNRKDALNFKKDGEWKPISADEMLTRIENIALGLYSLGIAKRRKSGFWRQIRLNGLCSTRRVNSWALLTCRFIRRSRRMQSNTSSKIRAQKISFCRTKSILNALKKFSIMSES